MKCIYCLLLVFFVQTFGHPMFMDLIPNGHFVPNPCGSGFWNAVGHYKPMGHTFEKNPFGIAFKANGFTWTQALCHADSDEDGMTNGEELGDPKCVWQPHDEPFENATSHPGICDPLDSALCRTKGFFCGCEGFVCFG